MIVGLAGVLLLAGCASSPDPKWWASIRAGEQAVSEKRPAEAEAHWAEALAQAERVGPQNWRVASTLHRMGKFYESQGRKAEAEQAYERTLAIQEKIAPRGPATARTITDLGHLYHGEGRLDEAEPLYRRALPIAEACFGPDHRNVDVIRYLLAKLYVQQKRYDEAEALYKQLIARESFDAMAWRELAQLYETQGRYAAAEPLRWRLLIYSETSGSPRELARDLHALAGVVRKQDRPAEATELEARAHAMVPVDTVEILSVTAPAVRRTIKGSTEFEMTVTVRYALRTADAAKLQVSVVRFQSAGCSPNPPTNTYAGSLLPITRGEGTQVVPMRWWVWTGRADAPGWGEGWGGGYVTVRPTLWSEVDQPRRLIRAFAQASDHCHALRAAESARTGD